MCCENLRTRLRSRIGTYPNVDLVPAYIAYDLTVYCPTVIKEQGYSHAGALVHEGRRETPEEYAERKIALGRTRWREALRSTNRYFKKSRKVDF